MLGDVDTAVDLALVPDHVCVVTAQRTVRCMGGNAHGQVGVGSTEEALAMREVPGLRGVARLAAGDAHFCALLEDGTVRCWGGNERGQVGDGTTEDRPSPVEVPGLRDVQQLAFGSLYSCALLRDGTVRCWGDEQLTDVSPRTGSSHAPQFAPTPIPGLTDVVEIAGGDEHACARRGNGSVYCWGLALDGRLGPHAIGQGVRAGRAW
jgi:alpha-tubulin suppressor-like RCC1 family protein